MAANVSSFPPQVGAGCRVLVLGTVPSLRSLQMRQSYAHPHNLFWPFMGVLYDAGPDLPYPERIARLHAAGVGIWDVLKDCERPGSLDSNIRRSSEIVNDIPALLELHPTIEAIALNGTKARQVFERRIGPGIRPERLAGIDVLALPSTSPANASIPRAVKLDRWRELLRFRTAAAASPRPVRAARGGAQHRTKVQVRSGSRNETLRV
ncbi:MAG TPA: DNA-deoxyinosine glycosylase [Rhodanobacteraceae bacterium]